MNVGMEYVSKLVYSNVKGSVESMVWYCIWYCLMLLGFDFVLKPHDMILTQGSIIDFEYHRMCYSQGS